MVFWNFVVLILYCGIQKMSLTPFTHKTARFYAFEAFFHCEYLYCLQNCIQIEIFNSLASKSLNAVSLTSVGEWKQLQIKLS